MVESVLVKSRSSVDIEKAASVYSVLRKTRPRIRRDLKNYVKVFLGIDIPDEKSALSKTERWIISGTVSPPTSLRTRRQNQVVDFAEMSTVD